MSRGSGRDRDVGDAPRVPPPHAPDPFTPSKVAMSDTPPPRVPGYELRAPGEADVLRALRRHFGPERASAIWTGAVQAAGLASQDAPYPPQALARIADVLRQQDGVARVIGRSLAIRVATYLVLRGRATLARPAEGRATESRRLEARPLLLSDPVSA
jgi:hypothetical protein